MKRETQLKIKQLLVIIVAWLALGFIMTVYDHLVLHSSNSLGPSAQYSFTLLALRNMGAGLIGALLGGSLLVFYINVKYQDKPYGYTILAVIISFILIVAFITLVMGITMVPMRTGKPLSDPVSRSAFLDFISDSSPLKAALSWSFIVAATQLMLQVNKKFGYGSFWNIIRGKYNTPREEKRIFMFLDLNSSTALAEQLGNESYHALLKDFFNDVTAPILNNNGNIYQYVGDEVIIVWHYKEGVENNQCLKCFFDIKDQFTRFREKYISRYGQVPSFKAGIHWGSVVAGEVGIIKRDITYSGDVLNTTSRIQSLCKEFKVDLIVSVDLLAELQLDDEYEAVPLGSIKLRGKRKEMLLSELKLLRQS